MSRKLDRHGILAEINRKGETLASIERREGLLPNTLSVALSRPFPKAEKVISKFLGKSVSELFAYRTKPNRKRRTSQQSNVSRVAPIRESQKCTVNSDMETAA